MLLTMLVGAQVKQNDKGYYVDADGSFYTGIITVENKDNSKSVFEVKDGLKDGEAQYFYASGKTMEKGFFVKGQKNDKWIRYNESGVSIGIASYLLGKKEGTWLIFDDNNKKRFEMHYKNGEKTGIWYNWDENGQVISTKDFSQVN